MSVNVRLIPIPINSAHAFFRQPIPVGSEIVEHWLAWFRFKDVPIQVVIDDDVVQIYKHKQVTLKTGEHPTTFCCLKGDWHEQIADRRPSRSFVRVSAQNLADD